MIRIQSSKATDHWLILEARSLRGTTSGLRLLTSNGRFQSLARFALGADGAMHIRSEIPPVPGSDALLDHARTDMTKGTASGGEIPESGITELSPASAEDAITAAREGGWRPEIRSGGDTFFRLNEGREARFGRIGGNESIYTEALPQLPGNGICQDAVITYALTVSRLIRLARPVLTVDRRLIWQVPMAGGFRPDLLDHALNALASVQRLSGSEIAALAANHSLASAWMLERKQH